MVRRRGFDGTEWQCKKCNQLNYASNKVCYRCSYSKAEAELEEVRRRQQVAQKQKVLAYIEQLNKKKAETAAQEASEQTESEPAPAAGGPESGSNTHKAETKPHPASETEQKTRSPARSPRARSRSRSRSRRRRREREETRV